MSRWFRNRRMYRWLKLVRPFLKNVLEVENSLPGNRLMVLAPHPDDEAIGCGGAVALHTSAGKHAEVVYCTTVGEPRDSESLSASKTLGFADSSYLRFPDGSLHKQGELAARLHSVITERQPDLIMLPFFLDGHSDHRALNEAMIKAFHRRKLDAWIYAFPVWNTLYPNLLLNIDSVWEQKQRAIRSYPTALKDRDYIAMAGSLGTYWARVSGHPISMSESYFRSTFDEYAALWKKVFK